MFFPGLESETRNIFNFWLVTNDLPLGHSSAPLRQKAPNKLRLYYETFHCRGKLLLLSGRLLGNNQQLKKFIGLLSSLGKKLFTEDFRNAVAFVTKCF
jgi:hypothetical protein